MARLQLAIKRMEFEGLGFSMVLLPGWKGVAMNPLHGGFISLAGHGQNAVLNVRCLSPEYLRLDGEITGELPPTHEGTLSAASIEALLRAQEWGTAPVELSVWESKPHAVVGATFPPVGERADWVREWFLTDGVNLANGMATPMICLELELLAECEEMLRSLRFG